MDFALDNLTDAFKSARYRERDGAQLFAFLLATAADRGVFPELLCHFEELDSLTGREVVIVAPSIRMRLHGGAPNPHEFMKVLSTGQFPQNLGYTTQLVDISDQVAQFMRRQMKETYSLISFLGLDTNICPAILFVEKLALPTDCVIWQIAGQNADGVVREFRDVIAALRRRCHWGIDRRLEELKRSLREGWYDHIWGEKYELEELRKKRGLAATRDRLVERLAHLHTVAGQFHGHDEEFRMPFGTALSHIEALCRNPDDPERLLYLRRHRRRWRHRMPPPYKEAVSDVIRALTSWEEVSTGSGSIAPRHGRVVADQCDARTVAEVEAEIRKKEAEINEKRATARERLERELEALNAIATQEPARPLDVIGGMHRVRLIKGHVRKVGAFVTSASPWRALFFGG